MNLKNLFRATILLALVLGTARCSEASARAPAGGRMVKNITVGEVQRSYILRLPSGYDGKAKLPLVLLIHGANDTAAYAEEAYHFAEQAEAEKFVLVLPDSNPARAGWNAFADGPNNDLEFLTKLLAQLPKEYALDAARVFVVGHSSGGCMAYRLAAERGDLIAAVGVVAGSVGGDALPVPKAAVPLILFHGKMDPTMPYGELAGAIAFWKKANGCEEGKTEVVKAGVTREVFASSKGAEIEAYTVEDGNHMWPGGKAMPGKDQVPVQEISATDLMWEFFKKHSR